MPSHELLQAQSGCSTIHCTATHDPPHLRSPTGDTFNSMTSAYCGGALSPDFLAALWKLRLELAIFELERRALPALNVFPNWQLRCREHDVGCTVPVRLRSLCNDPLTRSGGQQGCGVSDASATSPAEQCIALRAARPSEPTSAQGVVQMAGTAPDANEPATRSRLRKCLCPPHPTSKLLGGALLGATGHQGQRCPVVKVGHHPTAALANSDSNGVGREDEISLQIVDMYDSASFFLSTDSSARCFQES
ncbi:hypothetical protein JVU11DRAFT_7317 [Chiua virens]|nr:hypothetical protein JVU11DRAFT_7317 [Chiua virens]